MSEKISIAFEKLILKDHGLILIVKPILLSMINTLMCIKKQPDLDATHELISKNVEISPLTETITSLVKQLKG